MSELIIIVDCSGSMSGDRMKVAKSAIQLLLNSIDYQKPIKFNIAKFGTKFEPLFMKSVIVDDYSLENAIKYVKNTKK